MPDEKLVRRTFPVGALGCNCTIVSCPETREALVIDPGDAAEEILAALARDGLTAVKLIHTHAHFDHVMATGEVAARTGAAVLLHARRSLALRPRRHADRGVRHQAPGRQAVAAAAGARPMSFTATKRIAFGHRETRALHTPGHTPGSICLFFEQAARDADPVRGRHAVSRLDRPDRSLGRFDGRASESRSGNGS